MMVKRKNKKDRIAVVLVVITFNDNTGINAGGLSVVENLFECC